MVIDIPEIYPTRAYGIIRTLNFLGPTDQETLGKIVQPESVQSGGKNPNNAFKQNLKLLLKLGLVELDQKKEVLLVSKTVQDSDLNDYEAFISLISHHLVGKLIPEDKTNRHFFQFAKSIAWFLLLDLKDIPCNHDQFTNSFKEQLEDSGFKSYAGGVAYDQTIHWGSALGIFNSYKSSAGTGSAQSVVVVDPSCFLKRHMSKFSDEKKVVPIATWIKNLADIFPVFPWGAISDKVQAQKDNTLPESMSIALERLEDEGVISLEDQSDFEKELVYRLPITRDLNKEGRRISHICLNGVAI